MLRAGILPEPTEGSVGVGGTLSEKLNCIDPGAAAGDVVIPLVKDRRIHLLSLTTSATEATGSISSKSTMGQITPDPTTHRVGVGPTLWERTKSAYRNTVGVSDWQEYAEQWSAWCHDNDPAGSQSIEQLTQTMRPQDIALHWLTVWPGDSSEQHQLELARNGPEACIKAEATWGQGWLERWTYDGPDRDPRGYLTRSQKERCGVIWGSRANMKRLSDHLQSPNCRQHRTMPVCTAS